MHERESIRAATCACDGPDLARAHRDVADRRPRPVLTLHGAMGGHDQSELLAQTVGPPNRRYINVSRPGYLGTPLSSGQSPSEQADLFAALLDALQIGIVSVLAISGGGPSAIHFAARHPTRCCPRALLDVWHQRGYANSMAFSARCPLSPAGRPRSTALLTRAPDPEGDQCYRSRIRARTRHLPIPTPDVIAASWSARSTGCRTMPGTANYILVTRRRAAARSRVRAGARRAWRLGPHGAVRPARDDPRPPHCARRTPADCGRRARRHLHASGGGAGARGGVSRRSSTHGSFELKNLSQRGLHRETPSAGITRRTLATSRETQRPGDCRASGGRVGGARAPTARADLRSAAPPPPGRPLRSSPSRCHCSRHAVGRVCPRRTPICMG